MATSRYLTTEQAAEILGVSRKTIVRWCRAGSLEHWTTPGGHRRISAADVRRLLGGVR